MVLKSEDSGVMGFGPGNPDKQISINAGLVDPDSLVRKGIISLFREEKRLDLRFEIACLSELWETLHEQSVDMIFVDMNMIAANDFLPLKKLKNILTGGRIIVMDNTSDADLIWRSLRLGVDGYLPKNGSLEDFRAALDRVLIGGSPILPGVAEKIVKHLVDHGPSRSDTDAPVELSPREEEVLQCMTRGMCNKEISEVLHVTVRTVKAHVSNILRKMQVADRTQAVIKALSGDDRMVG